MTTAILLAAKSGLASAMSDLLVNTQRYASSICYALLGSKWKRFIDTEDMTQEVMIQLHNTLGLCKAEDWDEYLKWVAIVSRNVVYHELVKMKATKRQLDKVTSMADGFDAMGQTESPDQIVIRNEEESRHKEICDARLQRVMERAAGLSPVSKKIVTLLMEGLTQEQVASELNKQGMNLTRNAISGHMHRLKKTFAA